MDRKGLLSLVVYLVIGSGASISPSVASWTCTCCDGTILSAKVMKDCYKYCHKNGGFCRK